MSKRSSTLVAALGAAVGLAGAAYYWFLRRPQPQTTGRLRLSGLQDAVEILRDARGVPHIYAKNIPDLAFAQGYVHAQDRLWQMDFNRRLVSGRLSEILGEVTIPLDRWMRTLGMRHVAEEEALLMSGEAQTGLEAYARGINARIAQGRLPVEFMLLRYRPEPWMPADSLSWYKMMGWTLSVNWETELLRARLIACLGMEKAAELEPDYFEDWPRIVPPGLDYSCIGVTALEKAEKARKFTGPAARQGLGSNNWVIAGTRTTTGKPLLANDMHLTVQIPSIWYENHLSGGGVYLTGVSFPGIPLFIAGHNEHVAWGFTNGFPDVQDLYLEHLRRTGDGHVEYETENGWVEAQVRQEHIQVKGKPAVTEEVIVTRHGPIINSLAPDLSGEQPLALRWTALEPESVFDAVIQMARASNCLEFRQALRHWKTPCQNIVYADTDGNIGYSYPGRIPIRAKGDGRLPVPGWSGEYEWTGYIPFEELPHQYNPPQGYIVSANNRPVRKDYPYELGVDFCSAYRAQRIVELIESQEKISPDFIRQMQFDQLSPAARAIKSFLEELPTDDPELGKVIARMRQWDGRLSADSPLAAVYEVFVQRMLQRLLAEKLGDTLPRYMGKGPTPILMEGSLFGERSREWLQKILADSNSSWYDLGHGETRDQLMAQVLRETVDHLKNTQGPGFEDWAWGKMHQIKFSHPLGQVKPLDRLFNRGPYPLGGDGTTVWATGAGYDLASQAVIGPPFRLIADLADFDRSLGLLAPGESGHPGSPHYSDTLQAWFNGSYHRMSFSRSQVEAEAKNILRLEPLNATGGQ